MTDLSGIIQNRIGEMYPGINGRMAVMLEKYYRLVLEYNEKVNLTAITDPTDFIEKHYLDSLALVADKKVSRETLTDDKSGIKHGKEIPEALKMRLIGATTGTIFGDNVSRETISAPGAKQNHEQEGSNQSKSKANRNEADGQSCDNVSRETILAPVTKQNHEQEVSNQSKSKANDTPADEQPQTNVSHETILTPSAKQTHGQEVSKQSKSKANGTPAEEQPQTSVSREIILVPGAKVIDIGTGAGFPGIPLAIVRSDIQVTLLDSLKKRITFIEQALKTLGLSNCTAVHGRAEDLANIIKYREAFDVCVSRAVAALPVLCEYCIPFVKPGGYFVSYKSAGADAEIESASHAIKELGGRLETVDVVRLPGTEIERKLVIIKKVAKTPKKYPRKAGTPAKMPL